MICFESLDEFIDRAEELLYSFKASSLMPFFCLKKQKDYIYKEHTFSGDEALDISAKDKVWEYLMGYKYETSNLNNVKAIRGQIRKKEGLICKNK